MANPNVQVTPNLVAQYGQTGATTSGAYQPNTLTTVTDAAGNITGVTGPSGNVIGIPNANLAGTNAPGVSNYQFAAINSFYAPSLLTNTNAIPNQYNPADSQCLIARTFIAACAQSPAGNEVGTLNTAPTNTGAIFDASLGLVFANSANQVLTLDVSNFSQLNTVQTNGYVAPWMIYFEMERGLISALPSTSGLSGANGDYGGGIPISNSTFDILMAWPGSEGGVNGQTIGLWATYASGTGVKQYFFYSYGSNMLTTSSTVTAISDVHLLEGERYIPIVLAFDSGYMTIYVAGSPIASTAMPATTQNGIIKTITLGRRTSGTADYPFVDGHVRNLMVISGRSPLSIKSYGVQALSPSNVFSNTLNFGDSYSQINQSQPYPTGIDCAVRSYLGKFGFCLPNSNETTNTFGSTSNTSFPGRRLAGWSSSSAPVNANAADLQAFPTGSGQTYLWDNVSTFLANNPTCVVFQCCVNDFGESWNAASYSRWIRYYLERFFGLNGNSATTVKAVCLITSGFPPYMFDTSSGPSWPRRKSAREAYYAVIAAYNWFKQTYPAYASSVIIGDWYQALGGDNSYQPAFLPLVQQNIHPSTLGKYTQGVVWAQTLMNLSYQLNGNGIALDSVAPVRQLLRQYVPQTNNQVRLIGQYRALSVNSASTDYPVYLSGNGMATSPVATKYVVSAVTVTNASASLGSTSTATLGVFTGVGGTGTTVVSNATMSGLTTTSAVANLTVAATTTALSNAPQVVGQALQAPLYVRCGTAQGSAATVDVYIWGYDLT